MKKTLNIEEQKVCNKKKKFWTIGWVPSDDKNWMPVKLRAMKDATVDVKDSNPLTSDEPMFSSSRWVYDLTNIEISMMPRRDLTEKEQAYMEEMRQRYIAASIGTALVI